ncbi:unnamed protein product [Prorocentrum cordatum]|uniref:Phospholipase B-like n=1 Tax=Prorocentrum cordatum TaxID=2364126 RepID=A0ABN9S015_9DINO|nr:unnamed protein product [Polarella glacialis]
MTARLYWIPRTNLFSMSRLLFSCIAGASALHDHPLARAGGGPPSPVGGDPARVLLFGSSLDRNAIGYFCGEKMQSAEFLQGRWCYDTTLNVRMGSLFHPGVGYNGDLQKPFFKPLLGKSIDVPTRDMLEHHLNGTARDMLHGSPDLVVVESSLWDLAAWKQPVCGGMTWPCGTDMCSERCGGSACICSGREVSSERVEQWRQHDLPGLLELVQGTFPTSRIAFRTAPTVTDSKLGGFFAKFTSREVEMLYDCITSSTTEGRLFGKYEIVDYHAIVKRLADDHVPDLFANDGYHPSWYPSIPIIHALYQRGPPSCRGVASGPRRPRRPRHWQSARRRRHRRRRVRRRQRRQLSPGGCEMLPRLYCCCMWCSAPRAVSGPPVARRRAARAERGQLLCWCFMLWCSSREAGRRRTAS